MKRLEFGKVNMILLLSAVVTMIVGYVIMGTGDDVVSPVLLIISYVILIPAAIVYKPIKKTRDDE